MIFLIIKSKIIFCIFFAVDVWIALIVLLHFLAGQFMYVSFNCMCVKNKASRYHSLYDNTWTSSYVALFCIIVFHARNLKNGMLDLNLQFLYEVRYLELGERAAQHKSLLARWKELFANLISMSGNLKSLTLLKSASLHA